MTFMEAFQKVIPEIVGECKSGEELWDTLYAWNHISSGCLNSFIRELPFMTYCAGNNCGECFEREISPEDFERLCFQNADNDLIPDCLTNSPLAELFSQPNISDDDLMCLLRGEMK